MKLIVSFLLPFLAGAIGSAFTLSKIPTWYGTLVKPYFSPPNWLFGPVWTFLYLVMGISFYLVIKNGILGKEVKVAIIIFLIQLVFNALWSIIFFGLKNPFLAFGVIIVLWFLIVINIFKFYSINKVSGLILIPYLLWVSFASVLNYSIYLLNR